MCQTKPTRRFIAVEVKLESATNTQHSFGLEDILKNATAINAIEAYHVNDVSNSPKPGAAALVSDAVFKKAFLVLGTNDNEQPIKEIPLCDLRRAGNAGLVHHFDLSRINPSNCYIKTASAAGQNAAEVFLLGFHIE